MNSHSHLYHLDFLEILKSDLIGIVGKDKLYIFDKTSMCWICSNSEFGDNYQTADQLARYSDSDSYNTPDSSISSDYD